MSHPARAILLFPFRLLLFVVLLLKVVVRKLILGVLLALRLTMRNAAAVIVVGVLLVALVYTNLVAPAARFGAVARPGASPASLGVPVAKAVENYVQGQVKGDATLMWAAMSDDLRRSFAERGGSAQQLQRSIDQARESGRTFRDAQYVFGRQLSDGRAIFVYVLTAESPAGETREIPYMFTLGPDGKIESID
ncbi:MAG: hypothetical protein HY331_10445 [Chloroflexi bacterium]|nr:hypothetical protein [Chloroflexota bacterium]